MGNQTQVLQEVQRIEGQLRSIRPLDEIRKKYREALVEKTGRNVIAYYSGWLHGNQSQAVAVDGMDMQGFMLALSGCERERGLDLILHTPGGDISATESIVNYLHSFYEANIRAIVPQQAMSAGTMIALSCKSIVLGKHSRLGPIDPQINGLPTQAVLSEFEDAIEDIEQRPASAPLWQSIIGKYPPTFLTACKNANDWSKTMVEKWLLEGMCGGNKKQAQVIVEAFSKHEEHKSHGRQLDAELCKGYGVTVEDLEGDQDFQDAVLSFHHAYMHTLASTGLAKIIESSNGEAYLLK